MNAAAIATRWRWAWSLVVPWSDDIERGGLEQALAALTADQRALVRPQDKLIIQTHPPGGDPPRIDTCGL